MTVMKKRFLTIILSMLMVFVMMPMGTWTTYAAGGNLSQDDDGNYLIEDYADLKAFAELVNGGEEPANAKLTADITCTGKDWVPIGNGDNPYTGIFDGAGKTIENLSNADIEGVEDNDYQGLFGIVGNVGRVANVGLEDGSITGNDFVGGVAGLSYGDITNCYNGGKVSGDIRVGGVAGENYKGEITNCYNIGKVCEGSVVGVIGGVVGLNDEGNVKYCYNDKTINGDVGPVGNNLRGTELNYVTSIYSSQLTGTNSIDVFTDPDPWLTKADDKDTDASEYYWYYPHLKGFDYDNSLEVKDWPPKVTVKVNWDEAEAYTYNGFSQKPAVKKLTISNGATVVTAKPDKDYAVSYYAKDGDTYTAVTEDIINV